MSRERLRYLEAMAIYCEANAMVEEYQQDVSVANHGGIRNVQSLYYQLGLKNTPQVYETLEHRLVVAEAAQRLRLPLISKDGKVHEEDIEKWSVMSRSSLDSTSASTAVSSSSSSLNYMNSSSNSTADSSSGNQNSSARLPERIKLIIEEIEREEAALQEDQYSADRKFSYLLALSLLHSISILIIFSVCITSCTFMWAKVNTNNV